MAEKTYGQRALAAVTAVADLKIAFCGAASAAPPQEVGTAAPHGGRRGWVQGALQKTC